MSVDQETTALIRRPTKDRSVSATVLRLWQWLAGILAGIIVVLVIWIGSTMVALQLEIVGMRKDIATLVEDAEGVWTERDHAAYAKRIDERFLSLREEIQRSAAVRIP